MSTKQTRPVRGSIAQNKGEALKTKKVIHRNHAARVLQRKAAKECSCGKGEWATRAFAAAVLVSTFTCFMIFLLGFGCARYFYYAL